MNSNDVPYLISERRVRERIAAYFGIFAVSLACLVPLSRGASYSWSSGTSALLGLIAFITLHDGDTQPLGLRLVPIQGWRYWFRLSFNWGLWIALLVAISSAVAWYGPWTVRIPHAHPRFAWEIFIAMCLFAPLVEEIIFRSLLIASVLPVTGERGAVICSGVVFAIAHWVWGVASPENQVAGFLLAWAFLKSGSVLVPMAMHSAGNLIAFAVQIFNWYFLPETTPGYQWF